MVTISDAPVVKIELELNYLEAQVVKALLGITSKAKIRRAIKQATGADPSAEMLDALDKQVTEIFTTLRDGVPSTH